MAEILIAPLHLMYEIHGKGSWKAVLIMLGFILIIIGSCILMVIDAVHGVSSPFDPRSVFVVSIPWAKLFFILCIVAMYQILKWAYIKGKAN